MPDDTERTAKELRFEYGNGKPERYNEGLEKMPDDTIRRGKVLWFENGRLDSYLEGWEKMPDGTEREAKELFFKDGKPGIYIEGWEKLPDDTDRRAKELWLENGNGKPERYNEGVEELPDGTIRRAKALDYFENGSPYYAEGVKIHFRDGDITTTEKSSIKLINGKWVKQN